MRNFVNRAILVLIVMLFAAYAVYPPSRTLRLGKDLSGGVTLIYPVQIGQNESASTVMDNLITVLKQRVDPNGILNITMVQQGRDRLEITMPLPTEEVKALKRAYEEELAKIGDAVLTEDELFQIVRLDPAARSARIEQIAAGNEERKAALDEVAAARDEYVAAQAALEAAKSDPAADLQPLVDAVAAAEIRYDDLRLAILATVIDSSDVEQALLRSKKTIMKRDAATGEPVELPNPREQALTRLKAGQPPETIAEIDAIVKKWETYESQRRALDDSADLKRLLRGAGVLAFRITVDPGDHPQEKQLRNDLRTRGPRNVRADDAAWFKINQPINWIDSIQDLERMNQSTAEYFADPSRYSLVGEQYDGEFYILCYTSRGNQLTRAEGDWKVSSAMRGQDQMGRPAIDFIMDTAGSFKLAELTGNHLGDHMAVLLDDEVYTAPTLQGKIANRGQIMGDFSNSEIDYLIRTLNAGSLQAKLSPEPISENVVGPSLGSDQLRSGMKAGVIAIMVVAGFMLLYYLDLCGGTAVISLACNALLILGVMAANRAAFTLPGIAGVILTFGMAVDANVLIYERIREEIRKGADVRAASRLGYQKALSSIIDGNVTNLIVCLVLYYTGTQEIRGFAITLGIGVLATLFSVLVIGRLLFDVFVEGFRVRKIRMLPLAVPAIERVLTPKVNWIGLRWVFLAMSLIVIISGTVMVSTRGADMLGIEFRGGTMITVEFRHEDPEDLSSPRLTLERKEVVDILREIAADPDFEGQLGELAEAVVVPLNPQRDGVTSDTFEIRTLITGETDLLQTAISRGFESMLDTSQQVLTFDGINEIDVRKAPVYKILTESLRDNAPITNDDINVSEFVGGVAIFLDNITPPIPLSQLESRLAKMRQQPDFSRSLGRIRDIRVLGVSPDDPGKVTSVVVLVADENVSFFDNESVWWVDVAGLEWRVITNALSQEPPLASLQNFSPAIAKSFEARAVVSVLVSFLLISIYIWVRFGAVRYSVAALACLIHDVIVVVGLVAFVGFLWEYDSSRSILQQLKLLPFRLDLNLVAALLTIIGYSLNDTIIIMDRIRENRGKMPFASTEAVNDAVNSTISRTVITSGTTMVAVLILYTTGGEGVRAFSFALTCGVAVGTYSSIAIAAPLVWGLRRGRTQQQQDEREAALGSTPEA
jgi:SecD/SecF fusion protein